MRIRIADPHSFFPSPINSINTRSNLLFLVIQSIVLFVSKYAYFIYYKYVFNTYLKCIFHSTNNQYYYPLKTNALVRMNSNHQMLISFFIKKWQKKVITISTSINLLGSLVYYFLFYNIFVRDWFIKPDLVKLIL